MTEYDSNFLRSSGVAAERDTVDAEAEARWCRIETRDAQRKARERWSENVRLRHDLMICRWTIAVLVAASIAAWSVAWQLWGMVR